MYESVKAIKGPDDEHTPEETVDKTIEPDALRIISQNCSMEYIKRLRESPDTDIFSTAYRVGSRIRLIRKAKGLTQAELGEKVGLTADRVQKYENGIRKPKPELIQEFATALGVNRKALEDPIISDPVGALFALFEMEMLYNLKVERSPDNSSAVLTFGHGVSPELDAFLAEWEKAYKHFNEKINLASSEREAKDIANSYTKWKYAVSRESAGEMSKQSQRELLKKQIELLNQELEILGEE
jgi:transcriptional regulator with XRE-family HTH domain